MKPILWALVAPALLLSAPFARAMTPSLGLNLGVVVVHPDEFDSEALVFAGWPSHGFFNVVAAPGLRLGLHSEDGRHQLAIDNAFFGVYTPGDDVVTIQAVANYQRVFSVERPTSPYLSAGVGFASFRGGLFGGGDSGLSPVLGAGIGAQHRLEHGHGALRAELRYEYVGDDGDGGSVIQAIHQFGLRMGFDLWIN